MHRSVSHRELLFTTALVLIALVALTALFSQTRLYETLLTWSQDQQHQLFVDDFDYSDLVVIDIDEGSLEVARKAYGSWPFKRDMYANMTEYLRRAGARVIVYDILFEDSREGDDKFALQLKKTDNVALALSGDDADKVVQNGFYLQHLQRLNWDGDYTNGLGVHDSELWTNIGLPVSLMGSARYPNKVKGGLIKSKYSDVRERPILHRVDDIMLPGLHLAALGIKEDFHSAGYDRKTHELVAGGHRWPVMESGQIRLKFPKNLREIPTYSYAELHRDIQNRNVDSLSANFLKGKTIFIGSSSIGLNDNHQTPQGYIPGVSILAHVYASLQADSLLQQSNNLITPALIVVTSLILLLCMLYRFSRMWIITLATLTGLTIIAVTYCLTFTLGQMQVDTVLPTFNVIVLGVCLSIVRLKRTQDENHRLFYEKSAAEQANELKSEFLAHMTHELRTPLTAVIGFNRLLTDNPEMEKPSSNQYHRIIDSNCQHLLSLINNILDHARINAGQISVKRAPTRVRNMCSTILSSLQSLAGDKSLELKALYSENLPEGLMLDEMHMRRILINLVGNALKFTDKGHVHVRLGWEAGWLEVQVEDTGPGISPAVMQQIFESFQQGDVTGAKQYGGTGLGLTICRHMVQAMEGNIDVESEVGDGSVFILRVPAAATDVPEPRVPTVPKAAVPAKLSAKVLVADDNADLRALMNVYLTTAGCEVIMAENGQVAVEKAMSEQPDMVFMDLEMPVMDGYQAIIQLREREFASPIIACSAHTAADMKRALGGLKGVPTLQKPLRKEQLLAAVQRVLEAKG